MLVLLKDSGFNATLKLDATGRRPVETMGDDPNRTLRQAGIAGIVTGVLIVLSFVFLALFIASLGGGPAPLDSESFARALADNFDNPLFVASPASLVLAGVFAVPFFLGLSRALGDTLAARTAGTLGVALGLLLAVATTLLHITQTIFARVAQDVTGTEREVVLGLLQGSRIAGIDGLSIFAVGVLSAATLLSVGVAGWGRRDGAVGRGVASLAVVLGLLAIVNLLLFPDPHFQQVLLLVFAVVAGWRMHRAAGAEDVRGVGTAAPGE